MIGSNIAQYRVVAKLGAGGMGEVYRATDTRLGRDVALKLLPPETARDAVARAQLTQEARNASALNHPHICHIYEVNEADGVTYFAMELAEGEPLSKRIPSDGLPAETVLRFGQQIADALAHAHDRGILHRDLKSANVMVTRDGGVKVLDFGLAQRLRKEDLDEVTRSKITVQQAGAIAGTLPYLAPELLAGQPASERTDIWALGVLLHEMAAGALPFEGRTAYELTSAILREQPRPLERVPPALRAVVQRCLAKEPGQRYQKAVEARAALELIGSSGLVEPPPIPAAVRTRWVWPALGAIAFVAIILAVVQPWKRTQPPPAATPAPTSGGPPGRVFQIQRPSANPEANELLQRAIMFTRFQYDPLRARPMLERALQLDPKFSEARVTYALTFIIAVEGGLSNDAGDVFRAEQELRQALKENPEIPRAHSLLGAVHFFQGRLDLAAEEIQQSIRLAPAELGGGLWLLIQGRFLGNTEAVIPAAQKMIQSEPLFWPPRYHLAEIFREQGNTVGAAQLNEQVLEQDSQNVSALRCLARTHLDAGNSQLARQTLERLRPQDRENFRIRLLRAQLDAAEGKGALARKEMDDQVLKYADVFPFAALDAAEVYALLDEKEKAIEWLDRSMRKGDDRADWLRRDPLLAKVRDHPRFKQILSSMEFRRSQRAAAPAKQ